MKITLTARKLKSLLQGVLRLGTGDVTHPGYSLMNLEVTKKGAARATVINAQAAIRMATPADGGGQFEPGRAAVGLRHADMFSRVLPSSDRITVELRLIDAGPGRAPVMRARVGETLLKITTGTPEQLLDFPSMPDVSWRECSVEDLKDVTKHVAWCVAPVTDPRVSMQGVRLAEGFCEATDGHRAVRLKKGLIDGDVLVPPAALQVVPEIIGSGTVRLAVSGNRLWIQGGSFIMNCRLIDGALPDTSQLWLTPDENGMAMMNTMEKGVVHSASVSRDAMQDAAANMVAVFPDPGKDRRPVMRFRIKNGLLSVIMKNDSHDAISIAQPVPWDIQGVDSAALGLLDELRLDAAYVHKAVGSLPKDGDSFKLSWLSARDRAQVSAGPVDILIMPRQ